MRTFPGSDDDRKEVEELHVEPWMVDCLKLNPAYPHWGPHEDYMWKEGDGWDSRIIKESWKDFGPWDLNDYNEVVHFYFELHRSAKNCETCGATGYHPDALWLSESFYEASSPFTHPTPDQVRIERYMHESFGSPINKRIHGKDSFPSEEVLMKYSPEFRKFCEVMRDGDGFWRDKLDQSDVDALVAEGRLGIHADGKWTHVPRIAADVNAEQHKGGISGHDAINQHIVVGHRTQKYGIPRDCPDCNGTASIYTEEKGYLSLVLWMIHPRKGASRGIEVNRIQQEDLKGICKFLREGAQRNEERFRKVMEQL